ncbi:MAG TPA: amino acid ABC transporter substrate-binding protein [Acidimicrobiales bacterium]|nr:amino acid ABC transporter substrate-binding protein [Acidimicrobiales bacterium]
MRMRRATDGGGAAVHVRSAVARAGIAGALVAGTVLAAWSGTSGAAQAHHKKKLGSPVVVGASLSLSGDFSTDGQAFDRGYHLWQAWQNAHGGLLGHKIVLKILSDKSTPTQAATNYNTLISSDHAKLTIGPFSSLLTVPSAKAAHRHGYALVEGAGGAPAVFKTGLNNVFDVSYPVATGLKPFCEWVASMPKGTRPKTVAYATVTTIFEATQFPIAKRILGKAGVRTVYTKTFPTETTDFTPIASGVVGSHATIVILGDTAVSTVSSFMSSFEAAHFNPKAIIATSGPDQGAAFLSAVGTANAIGVMVEGGWYPGFASKSSHALVQRYVKKYGGTASGVNADVAEAFSVGEVLTQAVKATHGFTNQKIIHYLHSNKTFSSVQGPVKFDKAGENVKGLNFAFQWLTKTGTPTFAQVLPTTAKGSVTPLYPKPSWGS